MNSCGNAIAIPYVGSDMQPAGYPDRIVVSKFWRGFIEFKGPTTRIEPLQKERLQDLNLNQPGCAWIARAPNLIQDPWGKTVATWPGVKGWQLLVACRNLEMKLRSLDECPLEERYSRLTTLLKSSEWPHGPCTVGVRKS